MKQINSAVSLVGMKSTQEIREYLEEAGDTARFELSYVMSPEFLNEIEPLVRGRVLSVHACCPSTDYFPNFGSGDPEVIEQSFHDMAATLDTALRFKASIVVLHAGYATDHAMPSSFAGRSVILGREEFKADIRHADGAICGPDYNRKPSYLRFAATTRGHLAELARIYSEKGVQLAVENLNPRVGYLFHTPDELCELASLIPGLRLCIDVGHLLMSSIAYGFDLLEGLRNIVATGKVVTTHLHSNSSGPGHFADDHASMDRNGFPLDAVLGILTGSGSNLVIEAIEEPLRNTLLLRDYIESHS